MYFRGVHRQCLFGGALGTREQSGLFGAGTRVSVEQPGTRVPGRCEACERQYELLPRGRDYRMKNCPSLEFPG